MIRLGKILLVDDDESITRMMERSLVRLGYEVKKASSVEDAVAILSEEPQDLVISDMYMDGASGIDLMETMRAAQLDADVIVLSGQSKISTAVEAMRLGASNYLEKPVDLDRLKSAVREVFRARQAKKEARPVTPVVIEQTNVLEPSVSNGPQQESTVSSTPSRSSMEKRMAERESPPAMEKIGRFEIRERIGAGAMGTVFRAVDSVLGRTVALKVFSLKASDTEYVERFRREAKAAALLNHPNIATVHEYGEIDNLLFIAMEHISGGSLEGRLKEEGKISEPRMVKIAYQLADALEHAHALGIVHRDVKPGNILLSDGDRVKLVDFGVAHLAGSDLTGAGLMLGSPAYMSPEAALGNTVDYRADQFSVGTVLYEALSGEKPFKAANLVATIRNVISKEPPALSSFGVSAEMERIVNRLHAKEAKARYNVEMDLLEELSAHGKTYGQTLSPAIARLR